jgi:hypothetical protein
VSKHPHLIADDVDCNGDKAEHGQTSQLQAASPADLRAPAALDSDRLSDETTCTVTASKHHATTPIPVYPRHCVRRIALCIKPIAFNGYRIRALTRTPTLRPRNLCATKPPWIKTSRRCARRPQHPVAMMAKLETPSTTRNREATMVRHATCRSHAHRDAYGKRDGRDNRIFADVTSLTGASASVCPHCAPALTTPR